ncbi:chymotrypsin-2-like [Anthonomus grandis grandis]|uniref:chymotrypsin-2-like n=1 Tax=Anthonomus grandis grandis TaxID=2921223 RepID=UPI0021658AD0|nr:chymotrypsin-2-like [Anthonomus grandis grandis]
MILFQLSCVLVVLIQLSQQAAIENRIVNGQIVKSIEEYPYQVALFEKTSINDYKFQCGGSIISKKYILTAAHCVSVPNTTQTLPAEHIFVIAGKTSVAKFDRQLAHIPNKIIKHSNYNLEFNSDGSLLNSTNDIALINLKEPLEYSETINKVRLPKKHQSIFLIYGKTAVATGFGRLYNNVITTDLYAVNLTIPEENELNLKISDKILILGNEQQRGVCYGDSGGPLVVNGVQCGVTNHFISSDSDTHVPAYCHLGKHFVFANVNHYRDWISENSDVDEENADNSNHLKESSIELQ